MSTKLKLLAGFVAVSYVALFALTPFVYFKHQAARQQQKLVNAKNEVYLLVKTYNFDAQQDESVSESLDKLAANIKQQTVYTTAPGQAQFEQKSTEIQKAILHMSASANYSKKVGLLLAGQQFGGKFVNADDAANLAKKWQVFNDALKKMIPPTELQKQHAVLVASTTAQVVIANKAAEAYKANDVASIAAQTKAAADELVKIQAVYDDVYASVRAEQVMVLNASKNL